MITHFAALELGTVSKAGVKQFYGEQLGFPGSYESGETARFQPTPHFTLTFRKRFEPISPAHIAFQVPYSEFDEVVRFIRHSKLTVVKWADGRDADAFDSGKNIYFRDGDGNLLEGDRPFVRQGRRALLPRAFERHVSSRGRISRRRCSRIQGVAQEGFAYENKE